MLGLAASLVPSRAQVILNPNTLTGTVRFTNSNPAILDLLNPPGNEGMSNLYLLANSALPAPPISANTYLSADSRTSTDYQITVDSDNTGISYVVAPWVVMQGDQYVYYFNSLTSAPVTIGVPPPPLNFDECAGVVTVRFVTSGGSPVPVAGGQITAFDVPTGNYTGQRGTISAGVTQQRIYLRGGSTHRLEISVHSGTDYYTDRIETTLSTNIAVICDQFQNVDMVIPDSGTLATITGSVDLLGEFELKALANPAYDFLANFTSVIARYGPYSNQRWAELPGTNFTDASSGPFTLADVVPSTLDPLSPGYQVQAQMVLRTNRAIEVFYSPALDSGLNPALPVGPGESVDLTNLFVINPGYLRGKVRLQGPAESLGRPSLLRGLLHAGDDDLDGDGIPDAFGTYGVYWSVVEAVGVDRLASGASFSASGGLGYGDFQGDFNPATSAYEGQYELVLGGLLGESTIWQQKYLNVTLSSGATTNDNDYYYNVLTITETGTNDSEIIPTQPTTNDVAYCLSEVKVVFHSTTGTFYNPGFRNSSFGTFTNTDFLGRPANYRVDVAAAYGSPTSAAAAANIGQVVLYLPQGNYTLFPVVTTDGSDTGLQPIDISVGCGEAITLEPCLQLLLHAPDCTNNPSVHITGSVISCTNDVANITYTLNGGPPQLICNDCGTDPAFAFDLTLTNECADNMLVVTATNNIGGVSSITTAIHYDVTPPVITCPADIEVASPTENPIPVNFTVTATDNCADPVSIVCTPPSGSTFPIGTNTVTCIATDSCGNASQCNFKVVVSGCLHLTIEGPSCTTNYGFLTRATVDSCEATLTNLSLSAYSVENPSVRLGYSDIRIIEPVGQARTNLTTAHGLFPEFDGQPLSNYSNILYTAIARDNKGRVAMVQFVGHYDFTPPSINCPADITVIATNGTSAIVNYTVTADDGCPCQVIVESTPPSGSGFSIGTHTVTCRAHDLCHNTNICTFQITVLPPACPLRIELTQLAPPQVTLTWDCAAQLQSAPELAGPWAEIVGATSPHVTDAAGPQTFYRLNYSKAGTALQFPGTSGAFASTPFADYVYDPFGPAKTITAWIKTAQSTGAYPGIVTKYLGGSASGYALALNAGRLAPWYYYDATHFVEPGFSGPNDRFVADGLWHHVAFVVNTNSGRTFIDGQLVNTQPWTGFPAQTLSTEPLRLGTYVGGAGNLFIGQLDEVTIWSLALDASQINALMTTPPQGAEPGLQGYWRFDEAGGDTAQDWTGHGYNASLGVGVDWVPSTAPIPQ